MLVRFQPGLPQGNGHFSLKEKVRQKELIMKKKLRTCRNFFFVYGSLLVVFDADDFVSVLFVEFVWIAAQLIIDFFVDSFAG